MAGSSSSYRTFAALQAMLSEGWKIEPPIYVRPHWQSASNSEPANTYHFILCRESHVKLISIPESLEIEQLLTECDLRVDSL